VEYNNGVTYLHSTNLPNIVDGNALSPAPITDTAHVRIEALGSLLCFYINDALMYQFDHPAPLSGGQIGLGVIRNWTDGFDSVLVSLIPEADVAWGLIGVGLLLVAARRKRAKA